jgi:hypothetical protein
MLAGCAAAASSALGPDRVSRTDASAVTWRDGKPAVAVSCSIPSGCAERVNAICRQGPYTTLESTNMPTTGTGLEPQKPPSVVVRCG